MPPRLGAGMTDRRKRNANWLIGLELDGTYTHEAAQLAVLMDIRDELQAIRRRYDCLDTLSIPSLLRAIKKNTTKPRKRRRPA